MSEIVRNMLKAAADCLVECDSELSAQAHNRQPSSKEELTALYRRCRKLYGDINGALSMTETDPPGLLEASQRVYEGLVERIKTAPGEAVPVFDGIVDLHDAIIRAGGSVSG